MAGSSMVPLRAVQLWPMREYFQGKGQDIQRYQSGKEQLTLTLDIYRKFIDFFLETD